MNKFPRLQALSAVVVLLIVLSIIGMVAALMWRSGWFDRPTSSERYAREARREQRRDALSLAFTILVYAGTGVLLVALLLGIWFLRSKVENAASFVYAKGGLFPILRSSHRVKLVDGDGNIATFRRMIAWDPNRTLAPVTELGPEGAHFTAHGEEIPSNQMGISLGALTVQRQAAADSDGPITLVDDDVAVPDVVDHGSMPSVELAPAGHIQSLIEQSGTMGGPQ
jgi:hypothetical protein